jgi:molybdopterin-containing oxidoreductase family iron-sulfur binding subunit
MKITRKNFLRLAGGSVLAAGACKLVNAVSDAAQLPTAAHGAKNAAASSDAIAQRWGMAIDFERCRKGCTDCIRACNATHNIPQIPDPDREVKWIWEESYEKVFPSQRTDYGRQDLAGSLLLVLCNHCADPPCVRVCPTKATWKRDDGIVMMDYHRCIGCRYCMAACPYGSRSFNWFDPRPYIHPVNPQLPTRTKGVVEKCNFCEERLADGLLPACVEACSEKALIFGNLNDENSAVRQILRKRYSVRRKPELGTGPAIFYLV